MYKVLDLKSFTGLNWEQEKEEEEEEEEEEEAEELEIGTFCQISHASGPILTKI